MSETETSIEVERLLSWCVRDPDTECWEWTGGTSQGYGVTRVNGEMDRSFRALRRLLYGPIPTGLVPDHTCKNRRCCNPDHIEPVTFRENVLRGDGPTARNARKTHCRHGHALSGENLLIEGAGARRCRECKNAKNRRYYAEGRSYAV